MKKLHYSTRAKKDLKKHRNNPRKMEKLYEVLNVLVNDIEIPKVFQPHRLTGSIQELHGMPHRGRFSFDMD